MKNNFRKIILITIMIILSFIVKISIDSFFINTLFTISGIMFSVGIGLLVTFNLNGINNKKYINQIRKNINDVRNKFLIYFTISSLSFVFEYYLSKLKLGIIQFRVFEQTLNFNIPILFSMLILYSIIYFIVNFISLQKLNNDLFDYLNNNLK